jgi:hypothetical protein
MLPNYDDLLIKRSEQPDLLVIVESHPKNNSLFAVDGLAVVSIGSPEIWSGELWR